jgi:hypothetical protein
MPRALPDPHQCGGGAEHGAGFCVGTGVWAHPSFGVAGAGWATPLSQSGRCSLPPLRDFRQILSGPERTNGRFADYFIHTRVKLPDAPVRSTIWIQRL